MTLLRLPLTHRLPNPPAVFVGRDRDVERLTSVLERGPVAWVTGSGGIGKSALVRHALSIEDQEQRPAGPLMVVAIRPGDSLVDALITVGRLLSGDRDDRRWARSGADAEELLGDVLELAEGLAATVVVEDLHHGGDDVVDVEALVVGLANHASGSRWILTSRQPLAAPELAEQVIRLGPLDDASAAALAAQCGASAGSVPGLVAAAAGSPLAVRQGATGSGRVADLSSLPPGVVPLLRALSQVRQPLSVGALERLVDAIPNNAELRSLEEAGWLEQDAGEQRRLHDVVREALDATLSQEERSRASTRAATSLSDLGEEPAIVEALSSALDSDLFTTASELLEAHGERLLLNGRALWMWRNLVTGMGPDPVLVKSHALLHWALRSACIIGSPETLAWAAALPLPQHAVAVPPWMEAMLQFGRYAEVIEATETLELEEPFGEALRVKRARGLMAMGQPEQAMELLEGLECHDPVNAAHRDAYLAKALMLSGDYARATTLSRGLQARVDQLPPLERDAVDVERSQVEVALGGQQDAAPLFARPGATGTGRRRASLITAINLLLSGRRADAEAALANVEALGSPFDRIVRRMIEAGLAALAGDAPAARAAFEGAIEEAISSNIWAIYPWALEAREIAGRLLDADWPVLENRSPIKSVPLASDLSHINGYLAAIETAADHPETWPEAPEPPKQASQKSVVTTIVEMGWARTLFMLGDLEQADLFCATAQRRAAESGWALLHAGALMSRLPIVAGLGKRETLAATIVDLKRVTESLGPGMMADWASLWQAAARPVPDVPAIIEAAASATSPTYRLAANLLGGAPSSRTYSRRCAEVLRGCWAGLTLERLAEANAPWGKAWVLDIVGRRLVSPTGEVLSLSRQQIGVKILEAVARSDAAVSKEEMALTVWELPSYNPMRDDNRLHVSINRLRKVLARLPGADGLLQTGEEGYLLDLSSPIVVVLSA